jgi:FMN phosphatase YigB (HAD superfamily)
MKTTKVILFDLWRTLGYSLDREPIYDVQKIIGYKVAVVTGRAVAIEDPEFMRACLTTNISNPKEFLNHLASTFACPMPSKAAHRAFARVLKREAAGFKFYDDTLAGLKALKSHGYRLGLVSNLWPFPVHFLFEQLGLGAYFEHKIYSFEVGQAKPQPEIFEKALQLFGVSAGQVMMVGDNYLNDVTAALSVGMQAALILRPGVTNIAVPGARVISSLIDLCKQAKVAA